VDPSERSGGRCLSGGFIRRIQNYAKRQAHLRLSEFEPIPFASSGASKLCTKETHAQQEEQT
jgi:hypothetical protein